MIWDLMEASTPTGRFEIFNNVRTYQYAQAMGVKGLRGCGCECITQLACDPGPYLCQLTADDCLVSEEELELLQCSNGTIIPITADMIGAPWWSNQEPSSYDFAGLYSLGVQGFDSTLTREITPNALGGQSFGPAIRGGRCLTFDAVLVATSDGGLEYGFSYVDNLFHNLDACGFFTLHMPTQCPPDGVADNETKNYLRHLRRVTMTSGPVMIETFKKSNCCGRGGGCGHAPGLGGDTIYGKIQFTLCSESEFIFSEPTYLFEDLVFDTENEGTCGNRNIIPMEDQVAPLYGTRSILSARKRFPIKIGKDGSVCRVGGWEWSETQYGGGTGVVVLDSYVETEQTTLEEVKDTTTTSSSSRQECNECKVVLYWDVDGADPKHGTFETLRWRGTTPLPCYCDVVIDGYYVKNASFASGDPVSETNAPWKYVQNNSATDDCCYIDIAFNSTGASGTWNPLDAALRENWVDTPGRDPYTQEPNFPPKGCGLRVYQVCEDPDFNLQSHLANLTTTSYMEIETNGVITYYTDGSWHSEDGQSGCLPEMSCARDTVVPSIPIVNGSKNPTYYLAPDGSDTKYVGVKGPVTYNADGSWRSYDGFEGCLPTARPDLCTGKIIGVPYVTNEDEIGSCDTNTDCPINLETATDTWTPKGWYFTSVPKFPSDACNYYLAKEQREDKIFIDEQYLVNPGTCDFKDTSGLTQIFPSFKSDCWEPVLVPSPQSLTSKTCFCAPWCRVQKCTTWTNPSSFHDGVGNIELRTGGADLKNFRISAWVTPFDSFPSPCEDCNFWASTKPDFVVEIPHLPGGTTLTIDGEVGRSTLSFPGGGTEPGIRYISGMNGEPFSYLEVAPCDTVYIMIEASCEDTAANAEVDITFVNRYHSSGTFI